jgi:phosphoketolase
MQMSLNFKTPKKQWLQGYGVIKHNKETQKRVADMANSLMRNGVIKSKDEVYKQLLASDRVASATMWLVVHQTYASKISWEKDKRMKRDDFKTDPQGHTGGALNMCPAYVGYMTANAITKQTRGWVMEQGHAVSGIDSTNLILGNMKSAHEKRYSLEEKKLTRFLNDFYSYKINDRGDVDSPLGSHINPNTAGGISEGGYLGFAGLQYVYMPLPGESLVAFLSDGAWEEQRGSDWNPKWWRAKDCGFVCPVMIANGRRIDQRSTIWQDDDIQSFVKHLQLNNYDPILIDGRDPSAFAWAIFECERRLKRYTREMVSTKQYNVKLPYIIAVAPKGAGFYGEGTNPAHNLPLEANPSKSDIACERFSYHASRLFVEKEELEACIKVINNHEKTKRPLEKDNPMANRDITVQNPCKFPCHDVPKNRSANLEIFDTKSPMDAIDRVFLETCRANPELRPRVGNPDEMKSNRMADTLEALEFRSTKPEGDLEESIYGDIITVLNEEAVAAAAFGNKGGINLIVTYEAFGAKMLGEARQEVIFAKHQKENRQPAKWLSVPLVLTSNTWENSKNELSHQDTTMCEAMLAETSDISRVVFPCDYNSAIETIKEAYKTQGQVWTLVNPKNKMPIMLSRSESKALAKDGAVQLDWLGFKRTTAKLCLTAIGSYQLVEVIKASKRLTEKKIPHVVCIILEPGKFRMPRNEGEFNHMTPKYVTEEIFPKRLEKMVLVTHTRPEPMVGTIQSLWKDCDLITCGFINEGGTLTPEGMLFMNQCSWAHILRNVCHLEDIKLNTILSKDEIAVLDCTKSPHGIVID